MPLPPAAAIRRQLGEPTPDPGKQTGAVKRTRRGQRYASALAHRRRRRTHLSGLAQQIRLLGSQDLQQAAREVEHHVSWVRYVWDGREDELASYNAGVPPEARLRAAMHQLYVAARAQLGVSNPEEVASDEPIDRRQAT